MQETIDYDVGDYVVIKQQYLTIPACNINYPHYAYIVHMDDKIVAGAYVNGNKTITISNLCRSFYKKTCDMNISPLLVTFALDLSVDKHVHPGQCVRQRRHHQAYGIADYTFLLQPIDKLKEPTIVIVNDDGLLTVMGYSRHNAIIKKQIQWYQVSPHV